MTSCLFLLWPAQNIVLYLFTFKLTLINKKKFIFSAERFFKWIQFLIGVTLSSPETGIKIYWSLINRILSKAKVPIIPPLLENDIFVLDFTAKAEIFNEYFIQQRTTIDTGSTIPQNLLHIAPPLNDFTISDEKILKIIRSLNPNKAHGWDDISIRMIKLCDDALLLPPRLIFENCLSLGIFPEMWKNANVVPVHKKNQKNLKQNYRPISLLPIFGKILGKLIFDTLYRHLEVYSLLNPNQSGFRPGDSTVNQLLSIVNSIFQACYGSSIMWQSQLFY